MTIEQFNEYNRQGEVPQEWIGQGSGYKDDDFDWENGNETDIIYIPEYAYINEKVKREEAYSKEDLKGLCEDYGFEGMEQTLFDELDWQFPESLLIEWEQYGINKSEEEKDDEN